jgi:hypothetical protein
MDEQKTIMKQTTINYFFWILAAIFVALYFYIIYKFSINIPIDDDFAVQNFLMQFIQSDNLQEKISLLLEDGNGHRTLFLRLTVLLVYAACGKLNYSICLFIVNVLLFGTGVLVYKMMHNKNRNGLWAFLIVLLLFNGQNMGNSVVAQFGLSNLGSIFITLLSSYLLLINHRIAFICGLLLSLITIYSNGNGMLIIPPIIACFCVQKRRKELICFSLITIPAALLYFIGLNSSRLGGDIWNHLPVLIANFFIFIGCNLWIPSAGFISFFAGIGCLVVYIWGVCNKVYKHNLFCYVCLTFLFLTAIAAAVGNGPVLGGASTAPWRYRIYGSLFLILTAFLLVNNAKEFHAKKLVYLFPVLAVFFNVFSTAYCYRKGEKRLEQKKVFAYRWINEGNRLGISHPPSEQELTISFKEAERIKLYTVPQYPLSTYKSVVHLNRDKNLQFLPEGIEYEVEMVKEKGGFIIIEGWAYLRSESALMESEDIYLYFVNEENRFGCRPYFEHRFDIINDARKADCGFFLVIDKTAIPSGMYRIEIGIKSRLKLNQPVFYVSTDRVVKLHE